MTFESMISFMELDYRNVITEFSEDFKKRNTDRIRLLSDHKDEIVIFSGLGYDVNWTVPHYCDCEYCRHEADEESKFFLKKEDAEKHVSELEKDSDIDDIEISDVYYVRAAKQKFHKDGELF